MIRDIKSLMANLHIIIFSLDRAGQLDALLRSLNTYFPLDIRVDIIYNASNDFYENGYQRAIKKHEVNSMIKFKAEENKGTVINPFSGANIKNIFRWLKYDFIRAPKTNFKEQLIQAIEICPIDNIMFLVDDSYFYKHQQISRYALDKLSHSPSNNSYSLLLANNWPYKPKLIKAGEGYYSWDYYANDSIKEWKYPFSVVGTIYSKEYLLGLFRHVFFTNPNSLEAFVCDYVKRKELLRTGHCGEYSSLKIAHINRVQQVCQNESLNVSSSWLNEKYLLGFELNYLADEINSEHYESMPQKIVLLRGQEVINVYPNLENSD